MPIKLPCDGSSVPTPEALRQFQNDIRKELGKTSVLYYLFKPKRLLSAYR